MHVPNLAKQCTKCLEVKPLEDFCKNSSGKYGKAQRCRPCSSRIAHEYVKRNPVVVYANKYKCSPELIKELLDRRVCDICGKEPKPNKRNSIDHCHDTGKVRGILCDDCNTALGKFKDDWNLLSRAMNYLERHDA